MTTIATVLGLVPMALGIGEGSETNLPLARAVIGGLTVSTVFTLFLVPALYTVLDRFAKRTTSTTRTPPPRHALRSIADASSRNAKFGFSLGAAPCAVSGALQG